MCSRPAEGRNRPQGGDRHRRRQHERRTGLRGAEQCLVHAERPAHHPERQRHGHRPQRGRHETVPLQPHHEQPLQPAALQDVAHPLQDGHPQRRAAQGSHPLCQQPEVHGRPAAEHLRRHEHPILRAHRRTRREESGPRAPRYQGPEGPQDTSPAHHQGQGLRAGRKRSRRVARARQVQPRHGRTHLGRHQPPAAPLPGRLRRDARGTGTAEPTHRGRDARHAHRLLHEQAHGNHARPRLRRGHRRGTRGHLLGRHGQGRAATLLQQTT